MNNNFKTKKSLGQNFLNNEDIVNKICNKANLNEQDYIIEIGPGQGALTGNLLKKAKYVKAFELDDRLIPYLNEKFKNFNNFKLIHKDFLQTNKDDFVDFNTDNKIKVIANLPYYITTPIILKILLEYTFVDEIYVMVQKEVAERFTSEYKNKSYGSISVFLQSLADVKYEFTVPKEQFYPIPKIDSAIISIKVKAENKLNINIQEYEKFLKNSFKQKRKLLSNNLASSYDMPKQEIITFLEKQNFNNKIRPEEITVEQYLSLFNKWEKFISKEEQNV